MQNERKLSKAEEKAKERIVKGLKSRKDLDKPAKYAIATSVAKKIAEIEEARTKKGKKVPKKYLKGLKSKGKYGSKEAMKREIDRFAGRDEYKQKWDADYTDSGKRVKTKQSAATKAYQKRFGEVMQIDENSDKALKNKAKQSKIPLSILRAVFRKGKAAWNTGHRPGTSQNQWAMGRVNSFITGSGGARKADAKLWARAKKARAKKRKSKK